MGLNLVRKTVARGNPRAEKARVDKSMLTPKPSALAVRAAMERLSMDRDFSERFRVGPISCSLCVADDGEEAVISYSGQAPEGHKAVPCRLVQFPVFRQSRTYDCGALAVNALMHYYGYDTRQDEMMKALKTRAAGTEIEEICRYLRAQGFKVECGEGHTAADIRACIEAGAPPIITLQAWPEEATDGWWKGWDNGHYVVPVGYTAGHIVFSDPSCAYNTYLTDEELDQRWHDIGRTKAERLEHHMILPSGKTPVYFDNRAIHLD